MACHLLKNLVNKDLPFATKMISRKRIRHTRGYVTMRFRKLRLLLSLWACFSLAALLISFSCTKHRSANPVAPVGDPTVFITALSADPPLVDPGADSSAVTAMVVDAEGHPISGRTVEFTATLGTMEPQAVTDVSGAATAIYRSGSNDGVALLTASVGDAHRTVEIQVGLGTGMITAEPASLLADGISTSQITARMLEDDGQPRTNITVFFSTTCGQITSSAVTDGDGRAVATLTAPVGTADTTAYISVSTVQARGLAPDLPLDQRIRDRSAVGGQAAAAKGMAGAATAELGKVEFRGIRLSVVSEDTELSADGLSSTQLTATMTESSPPNEPVTGLPVTFTCDLGSVSPREVTTDADGAASATLTSGKNPGTANVWAQYRLLVVDSTTVTLRALSLTLTIGQPSLLADGQSTIEVTARLLNSDGNPVSGASLDFTADLGSISSPHTTGADGRATATLTSSTTPGTCHISASYGSGVSVTAEVEFSSYDLSLCSYPSSLLADGVDSSLITVVLRDGEGSPLADEMIQVSTDLGEIAPPTVVTDAGGNGQARLTSWASASDTQAVVTATFKGSSGQTMVTQRGVSLTVSSDPSAIVANGTSQATITATLQEATSGLPLASRKIIFGTNLGTITEEVLTNSWGQAEAVLSSDLSAGTATVTARYGPSLQYSTPVEFLPTDVSGISLESEFDQLLADGEGQSIVTATVTDADGQPLENVAVNFSCDAGSIDETAVTDQSGQAQAAYIGPVASIDQTVTLTAIVGTLQDEIQVALLGVTFSVQVGDEEVLADGLSGTEVVAQVRETTSGLPLVGRTISFRCFNDLDGDGVQDGGEVGLGQIDAQSVTDASGQARATLLSQASGQDLEATVRAETEAGLAAVDTLTMIGLVLEMTADPASIVANGVSTTTVSATLRENNRGYGVAGKSIQFTTNLGELAESRGTTDEIGQVAVILMSSTSSGAAQISASYGNTITGSTAVNFTAVEAAEIQLAPETESLLADGVDATALNVVVTDADGNPIADLPVSFESTVGSVPSPVTTDEQGQASAVLTSVPAESDTVATVTATAGSISQTAEVTLRGVSLELSCYPGSLLADGMSSAAVTALYKESTSGQPLQGETISFLSFEDQDDDGLLDGGEALLGTVTSEATTDASGQAVAAFVSPADSDYRVATVRAVTSGGVAHSATIPIYGVRLDLAAGDSSITANGSSTTEVVAFLTAYDGGGASGPIESKTIVFSTNLGSLSPESGITGSTGQVHTTLTSSSYPGTALIQAACGEDISKTIKVVYTASVPDSIMLSAEPAVLPADGVSTSQITANVIDANHNPVSDGTLVSFQTSAGMITESDVTAGGVAQAILTSCTTPGQVTITASAARPDSGEITSSPLLLTLTSDQAASIALSAEPDTIRADGSSTTTLTALVLGPYGNPVTVGMEVNFQTSLGSITPYAFTNEDGVAQAVLTSETTTGMAVVTASATGASAHAEIHFISGEASNIVMVAVTDDSIGVQGSGDNETATLTFEVRDDTGSPLDLSQQVAVDFEIVGPAGGGEFLEPTSDVTDAYGRVQTTLNSGTVAKTVKIKATIDSLSISSEAISIAIHGGPPDAAHFSVVPQYLNFAGWKTYGLENTVTAFVGDQYGNPVPEGTSVYFSTSGGIVEGSGNTNSLGQASVTLVSSSPLPVSTALDPSTEYTTDVSGYCDFTAPKNGDGQAIVFAQTVDRLGTAIWTNTRTIFSGDTGIFAVSPTSFAVANGGSQSFSFRVHDLNGNPLTAGTAIAVSATVGDLVGDVNMTLPDTQSSGWTQFSFLLMDDDAAESDPAQFCILTITVNSSNNGNASTVIMGTVD
jgi:adhesin/invasin